MQQMSIVDIATASVAERLRNRHF